MYYLCSEKYVKRGNLLSILVVFFDIFQRHICSDIINRGKKLYHFLTPFTFLLQNPSVVYLTNDTDSKNIFYTFPILVVENRYSKIRFWGTRFSLFFAIFFVILKAHWGIFRNHQKLQRMKKILVQLASNPFWADSR